MSLKSLALGLAVGCLSLSLAGCSKDDKPAADAPVNPAPSSDLGDSSSDPAGMTDDEGAASDDTSTDGADAKQSPEAGSVD